MRIRRRLTNQNWRDNTARFFNTVTQSLRQTGKSIQIWMGSCPSELGSPVPVRHQNSDRTYATVGETIFDRDSFPGLLWQLETQFQESSQFINELNHAQNGTVNRRSRKLQGVDKEEATSIHIRILTLETDNPDYEQLEKILKGLGAYVVRGRSIQDGLMHAAQQDFNLILSDYLFADGTAFDLLRCLKQRKIEIPMIVVSGAGDEIVATRLIQSGVYDYLPKDRVTKTSLLRSIATALEKQRLRNEIKKAQAQLANMATRDDLTNLFNRRFCAEALNRELARSKRYGTQLGFCLIDIDNFKHINDTYGHPVGDTVLQEVSRILLDSIRESDLACRYGGDEFALILTRATAEEAHIVCERFRRQVEEKNIHCGSWFRVTVSVGIAISNSYEQEDDCKTLIARADRALYQAKDKGKNALAFATDMNLYQDSIRYHWSDRWQDFVTVGG